MLKKTQIDPFKITQEQMNIEIQNTYKEISSLDREIEDRITQYSFDIFSLNTKIKAMIENKFLIRYNGILSFSLHELFQTTLSEDKFIKLEYSSNSFYLQGNWIADTPHS